MNQLNQSGPRETSNSDMKFWVPVYYVLQVIFPVTDQYSQKISQVYTTIQCQTACFIFP